MSRGRWRCWARAAVWSPSTRGRSWTSSWSGRRPRPGRIRRWPGPCSPAAAVRARPTWPPSWRTGWRRRAGSPGSSPSPPRYPRETCAGWPEWSSRSSSSSTTSRSRGPSRWLRSSGSCGIERARRGSCSPLAAPAGPGAGSIGCATSPANSPPSWVSLPAWNCRCGTRQPVPCFGGRRPGLRHCPAGRRPHCSHPPRTHGGQPSTSSSRRGWQRREWPYCRKAVMLSTTRYSNGSSDIGVRLRGSTGYSS